MTETQPPGAAALLPMSAPPSAAPVVAVVIPCFRTSRQILSVIDRLGPEVHRIFVVDDQCPEHTGDLVERECRDPRVLVLRNPENRGVGGAVMTGYQAALDEGADVVVKVDGDGQMDPALLPQFIAPILAGKADYTKGNRFFSPASLRGMPAVRLFGNSVLSFVSKLASGYWDIMDPTNGYTAIHRGALSLLPLQSISNRYFFESDMLFRLSTVRAVVRDVPMSARYADETSSLRISKVIVEFPPKYLGRMLKRLFYLYYLRDFNVASLQMLSGTLLFLFGVLYGGYHWIVSLMTDQTAPTGVVMLAALPTILGFQLLLAAIGYDVGNVPRVPLLEVVSAPPRAAGTLLGAADPASRERVHAAQETAT
jgi:dolichol-phosphate mannosyltransferase